MTNLRKAVNLIPDGRDAFMQEVLANPDKEYLADVVIYDYFTPAMGITSGEIIDTLVCWLTRNWEWVEGLISITNTWCWTPSARTFIGYVDKFKFEVDVAYDHPLHKELRRLGDANGVMSSD